MKTKKSCDTCYWNIGICVEEEFEMPIEEAKKLHPNGCESWRISFEAFCQDEEEQEAVDIELYGRRRKRK